MKESIIKKLKQPEGRRLEFKETVPKGEDLAKTVIAFSNDAGGEIFVGIKNEPREIVGIPDEALFRTEEQIANIVADLCEPTILPEITFVAVEDKTVIRVKIHRGSQVPYYLKTAGKLKGTYIRVGSSNRLASEEIIQELERLRRNVSFDSLPVREVTIEELDFSDFLKKYEERTGEKLDKNGLRKLELIKEINGQEHPTNAALLLCSSKHKQKLFPYAKIECARFKGTKTEEFLDQATIESSVVLQPEEVMRFGQRNIAKGATLNGIYREDKWEYPLIAIREAVINAIVHRDYSLTGKDIKVAIFDDMLEITSAGTLPPSIDITELSAGQSEIRNRVLAPIFKKLGLIEQWGTGFRKIQEALKEYPNVELRFNEPGMAFQMQFVKKDYQPESDQVPGKYPASTPQVSTKLAPSWHQSGTKPPTTTPQLPHKLPLSSPQVKALLEFCLESRDRKEIQKFVNLKDRKYFHQSILKPLLNEGILEMLYPDAPNSPKQKYTTTKKGKELLKSLEG